MSKQSIPAITMSESDRRRLEKLARAAAAQGDRDGLCLMGEINRAATVPDRAAQLDSIVNWSTLKNADPKRPKSRCCRRWARR